MAGQIRLSCIVFFMAMIASQATASTENPDEPHRHHRIGVTGEIKSNVIWQLEASYHWFPFKYMGMGASVGIWKEIGSDKGPATNQWRINENSKNATSFFLMPSVVIQTPALIKTDEVSIGLMAEPGVMMNVPYDKVFIEEINEVGIPVADSKVSYNKGKWFAFSFRVGAYASFGNVNISLGYVHSDLDIYAMRRNMQYRNVKFKNFYPEPKNIGGLYIGLSLQL